MIKITLGQKCSKVIFLLIINFLQFIFIKNKLINYIFLLTVPMTLIYFIISKNKLNKKIKKQKNIDDNNLKKQKKKNLGERVILVNYLKSI